VAITRQLQRHRSQPFNPEEENVRRGRKSEPEEEAFF
jgi:hypothetical protein